MAQESPDPVKKQKKKVTGRTRDLVIRLDKIILSIAENWLRYLNTAVGIYVGLPILAPVLMQFGATGAAGAIYRIYSPLCHQSASRSFFLFGEQIAYPSEVADTDFTSLESYAETLPEFSGVNLGEFFEFFTAARAFVGNAQMGYKMALCERDIAIYFFIFVMGLIYGLVSRRREVKPIRFITFVIFFLLPIGWDGFSQLFGYFFEIMGSDALQTLFYVRESTPLLRSGTGALFGTGVVWLIYPHIAQGMRGTAYDVRTKLVRAGVLEGEVEPPPWEQELQNKLDELRPPKNE
ncbi:MAG: DUF2085 domain-containing protein [Chloroflexota bacterium]